MRLRSFLASALLVLAGCSDDPPDPFIEEDAGGPPIWEITSEAGEVEGWLFGTVHALPAGTAWRSAKLEETLQNAELLVVEVASLEDQAELSRIFTRLALDEGGSSPLAARIDPALRVMYREVLIKSGTSADQLDPLETWAAALTLAQLAQTAETEAGVDKALLRQFGAQDVTELEGARAQLSIFDGLPESEQRDLLNAVLRDANNPDDTLKELVAAWQAGDLDLLSDLATAGLLEDPELYEALLAKRNRDWAARIEPLLARQDQPFIAVGAAHMLGDDGLPTLLRERGFTISRIQ
ncbi:TraB/GumN family protein [Qipengyuania sp. DGS5-3]|uniref:TraB/GumN family protein n=1 Tax=Qipengyuania sp. DGS5-3 TaxID=3349632 RepID=UPI0036D32E20